MNKNFKLYIFGRFISDLGDTIQVIGFPLLLLDMTQSATILGLATIFIMVFEILIRPFLGVIADNYNRKKIMVEMDFISGILCLVMAYLIASNIISVWMVFVYLVIQSIISTLFDTSTYAMLPEIVEEQYLEKANSNLLIVSNISSLAGPPIGAFLYSIFGIKMLLFINGITFILSGISEFYIEYKINIENKKKLSEISFFNEIKNGIKYLKVKKELKHLLNMMIFYSAWMIPIFAVFIPVIIKRDGGFSSTYVGLSETFMTIGSLTGASLITFIMTNNKKTKYFKLSNIILNIAIAFLGIVILWSFPNKIIKFLIISIILFMFNISFIISNVIINSKFQMSIDNEIRGRIGALKMVIMQIATIIGISIGGRIIDKIHSGYYLIFLGMTGLLITIFYIIPYYHNNI
ncbi:MFS transporter [Marinitoga lauensis]|uniref:MFS transporter n=1 Tax=Marinitoga lauensis TaxID=2201189 RepID=UPI00140477CB|nr:MFS transporter [Marinitoga lauensis]